MIPEKIGFIGLGHIGGSVAKTIHRIYPGIEMIAFDTTQETLDTALEEGVIQHGYNFLAEDFSTCNYIYLCAPVLSNSSYLPQLKDMTAKNPSLLITDVGSVKTGIHQEVIHYDLEANFIGGHPMCGTEFTGYAHATAYMLENAYYVITPSTKVAQEKADEFKAFTDSLGALTLVLDYEEHDFIVGAISHLPHVISATLVNLVKAQDNDHHTMRQIAAGGFKDITRISSSSPLMWEHICQANKSQILKLLDLYASSLEDIRATIALSDSQPIHQFFASAKDYRDTFSNAVAGPLGETFHIFVDLADEAGGIATVTTILATNDINIKNIGITHNREFLQGALSLEFYNYRACKRAIELLQKYHYTVYEK